MRSSLDYAGFAQLCGRSPIMREIMRAHNRIIPRSLQYPHIFQRAVSRHMSRLKKNLPPHQWGDTDPPPRLTDGSSGPREIDHIPNRFSSIISVTNTETDRQNTLHQ